MLFIFVSINYFYLFIWIRSVIYFYVSMHIIPFSLYQHTSYKSLPPISYLSLFTSFQIILHQFRSIILPLYLISKCPIFLSGNVGVSTVSPSRYIRFIFNRVILENAVVRAAAVSTLGNATLHCPKPYCLTLCSCTLVCMVCVCVCVVRLLRTVLS